MADSQLIVDDEYCKAMANYFVKQGQELDSFLKEYIKILETTSVSAIVDGDVAKALKEYISYAKRVNDQIPSISKGTKNQIKSFISRIDQADQYLF